MKIISRVMVGIITTFVLLNGSMATPVSAALAPGQCEWPSKHPNLPQDKSQAPQTTNGYLASHKHSHDVTLDETGVHFKAKHDRGAPADIGLTLTAIMMGKKSLPIDSQPQGDPGSTHGWSACQNLAFRGRAAGVVEAVGLYDDHIDLEYVFDQPPFGKKARGDITLTFSLNTGMEAQQTADGIVLTDQFLNGAQIGQPTAVDAAGNSLPLTMFGDENAVSIVIPSRWLASAAYPVTIDPTIIPWAHSSDAEYAPFMAADPAHDRALVAFTDETGGNYDVGFRLIDTSSGNTLAQGVVTDAGDETSSVATYNSAADEYMVAYARGNQLFAQRVDSSGALAGGEIGGSVGLGGGTPSDADVDPVTGRTLVVWVTAPQPGNMRGVLIDQAGSFVSSGFDIQATDFDERHPHVTYDPTLFSGAFVTSWKQSDFSNNFSILGRYVKPNGGLGPVVTFKGNSTQNVTNRKIVYSADVDTETGDQGQYLVIWNNVDNNNLMGVRVNNRTDTVKINGGAITIRKGKPSGYLFNDKTSAFPDLSPTRKGWVVVWRERNNTVIPFYQAIHWLTVSNSGKVGPLQNVTANLDASQTEVSNPVVMVRIAGQVITVHEQTPLTGPGTGQTTLYLTLN